MQLGDLSDRQLSAFIRNYEADGRTEGGKFSLTDLRLEQQRRIKSPFPPRETALEIVRLAKASSDGLVTYKEVWQRFRPEQTWTGNAPRAEMAKALASVIAFCVDHDLPILTALVVRGDSRSHSEDAVMNIYREANELGVKVGIDAQAFVRREQETARSLSLDRFAPPNGRVG